MKRIPALSPAVWIAVFVLLLCASVRVQLEYNFNLY